MSRLKRVPGFSGRSDGGSVQILFIVYFCNKFLASCLVATPYKYMYIYFFRSSTRFELKVPAFADEVLSCLPGKTDEVFCSGLQYCAFGIFCRFYAHSFCGQLGSCDVFIF